MALRFSAILAGGALAAAGVLLLAMAVLSDVGQGRMGLGLCGAAFVLAAAPVLAVPFSVPLARRLLFLVLACLAAVAIRCAFWPQAGVSPVRSVQAAIIAFAVLLVLRTALGWRGKRAGPGA